MAVVVLPSDGDVEVMTISCPTPLVLSVCRNSIFVWIRRNSSAMAPFGCDTMTGRFSVRDSSCGTEPNADEPTTPRTSEASSTLVFSKSLISTASTPTIMPKTTPTARYSAVFGELFEVGVWASYTMDIFTGDLSEVEYKSFWMTSCRDSATALAMSAACFGSPSTAEMFTNALLVGLVTVS